MVFTALMNGSVTALQNGLRASHRPTTNAATVPITKARIVSTSVMARCR